MRDRLGVGFALGLLVALVAGRRTADAQTTAYEIPAPVAGNQAYGFALGHDFNLTAPISVTELGVFDSNADGLGLPLNARIYNRNFTSAPLVTVNFAAGAGPTSGTLAGSQRFLPAPSSLVLPNGFLGTVVGEGYGGAEQNGNSGGGNFDGTILNGGGAISFVGSSRFSGGPAGSYPTNPDGGGPARYGTGTFRFTNTPTAVSVGLQNATAILSQGGFNVSNTLDGSFGTGWANSALGDNTAVFETTSDVTSPLGKQFQFTLTSGGFGLHTLGRFRISATEDDRSTFADGLQNGGDVTANWVPLDVVSAISGNPTTTFTELADGSVLAGGGIAEFETYTITANAPLLDAITGFRIEMLEDPSLPGNGPGRAGNGNYVLYEFNALAVRDLTAAEAGVPEPASVALWTMGGLIGAAYVVYRRRKAG
jgi:hypothetical protein